MVDRVKPLKLESPASGGTETDLFSTSLNKNEDFVDCRGVAFQSDISDDETVLSTRDSSNRMTFKDAENTTPRTLTELATGGTGLTEATHKALDTLIHGIAEDSHQQLTRSGGRLTNVTFWTDSGETQKIREIAITRTSGKVSQIVVIQYDGSGVEKVRITGTVTRSSGRVDSIDWVETVA